MSDMLRGRQLTISYINGNRPYTYLNRPRDGIDPKVLDILGGMFGFTYSMVKDSPFDWVKTKNGSSKGVIYKVGLSLVIRYLPTTYDIQVATRQADIGIGQVSVLHYRYLLAKIFVDRK